MCEKFGEEKRIPIICTDEEGNVCYLDAKDRYWGFDPIRGQFVYKYGRKKCVVYHDCDVNAIDTSGHCWRYFILETKLGEYDEIFNTCYDAMDSFITPGHWKNHNQ